MKDLQRGRALTDFARVIAPMTLEQFMDEYFEKRHLVIRREDRGYFDDLLSVADIDTVLTTAMIPGDEVAMVNTGTRIEPDDYVSPGGFVDPVRVAHQFGKGATLILQALHRRLPALAAYCRALETVFSCDLQTNIYFTPGSAQGFKTHYDSHDVFVLQTHGSKTWRIYDSPIELPLLSQPFTPDGFEPGAVIDSFVLNAGDVCYVPRGVVHDAIATDEMSLHITTGLLAPRWIDLLVDAIAEAAKSDVALRGSVTPGFGNHGFDRAPAVARLAELMQRAAQGIDPAAVLDRAAREFRGRRVPVAPGQLLESFAADEIGPGAMVERRPDVIHTILEDEDRDEVVLDVYGTEVALPLHAAEALRDAMARTAPFRVGELAGDLDDAGQAVLVRRLVREGVLRRVS